MYIKYSYIIILLFIKLTVFAESFIFDKISYDEGLSSSAVSSIAQDSKGFIWIGTHAGLNLFDGYNIKTFYNNPFESNSLTNDLIQTLYMDDDILWIGSYNGVSRLDIKTMQFENYVHDKLDGSSLSSDVVTDIIKVDNDYVWIATLDGLNRLDLKTKKINRYRNTDDPTSLSNNVVRSLLCW